MFLLANVDRSEDPKHDEAMPDIQTVNVMKDYGQRL
jgi:hypothetical protein